MLTYEESYAKCLAFLTVLRGYNPELTDIPSVLSGVAAALAITYEKQTSEVGEKLLSDLEMVVGTKD